MFWFFLKSNAIKIMYCSPRKMSNFKVGIIIFFKFSNTTSKGNGESTNFYYIVKLSIWQNVFFNFKNIWYVFFFCERIITTNFNEFILLYIDIFFSAENEFEMSLLNESTVWFSSLLKEIMWSSLNRGFMMLNLK